MTKLKIISRLWSHVIDLRMLIEGHGTKTLEEIESELDVTEYYCRPYADIDDTEDYPEEKPVENKKQYSTEELLELGKQKNHIEIAKQLRIKSN